jgi:hypothetical protein
MAPESRIRWYYQIDNTTITSILTIVVTMPYTNLFPIADFMIGKLLVAVIYAKKRYKAALRNWRLRGSVTVIDMVRYTLSTICEKEKN